MPRGGPRNFRYDRETVNHDADGKKKGAKERRRFLIGSLKKGLHLHEYWSGSIYEYRLILDARQTRLCGTDACFWIKADAAQQ